MNYLLALEDYFHPWRIFTLLLGLAFLIAGATYSGLPDWDIPISLLMAVPAYITAPCTLRVIVQRRWHQTPWALYWTWITVDGIYVAYWEIVNAPVVDALRFANLPASLALYLACGLVWYPYATTSWASARPRY